MATNKLMNSLMENNNGYLLRSEALSLGVSKNNFESYIKNNALKKLVAGVYLREDVWVDEMYILCLKNRKITFSHESALYLHNLMEREPRRKTVTVKHGYNAEHLRKKGIKVVSVLEKFVEIGKTEITTNFGNIVKVYDMERTICDIIRNKDDMDIQVFLTAIKEYMNRDDKNIPRLMQYARVFGIEDKIRIYTEVLL